ACPSRLIDLVVAHWAALGGVYLRVGTYFAPVEPPRALVHGDSVRIAIAHHEDLRTCLLHPLGKEISVGNRVRAIRLGMNAKNLPAQIVRVRRRLLRIPWRLARPFVEWRVTRMKGIRVVTRAHEQIAMRVERDRA